MIGNLTDEQVRAAREEFIECGEAASISAGLFAAAPFLQIPWDEPTEPEMNELYGHNAHLMVSKFVRRRNAALQPKPCAHPSVKQLPNYFNALAIATGKDQKKLVFICERCGVEVADPRKQIVAKVLYDLGPDTPLSYDRAAEAVLEALDAAKNEMP